MMYKQPVSIKKTSEQQKIRTQVFESTILPIDYPEQSEKAYLQLQQFQIEKNNTPGLRFVPAKLLPIPENVSPELAQVIASPYNSPRWYANHAKTTKEWETMIAQSTQASLEHIAIAQKDLNVHVKVLNIVNVDVYEICPKNFKNLKKDKIVIYIHGGGFVYNPGITGTQQAMQLAIEGYRVLSIDYRMLPDHPYPAALDDIYTVYQVLLNKYGARNICIYGSSAGGNLVMALLLKAKAEKLDLPAAIGLGSPWIDLRLEGGGDSINTLQWVDNTLISPRGYIQRTAQLYANGEDLSHHYISPIFGDFSGFPPVIIISGTRDLFLSQCVMVHRKFKQAKVEADLQIWDGMSHDQYEAYQTPESKEVFYELGQFFFKHLYS